MSKSKKRPVKKASSKRRTKEFKRRSAAASKGWATRRRNEREAQRKRDAAARRRKSRRRAAVAPTTPPRPVRLPVYDSREVERGAELGYADTLTDAYEVAEHAAPDGEELLTVDEGRGPGGKPAYIATFGPAREEPPEYDEPLDDLASEWEIGFEYRGADKGSFVDVNIRIAREDGEAFGPKETARVLAAFQESLLQTGNPEIPAGYMMAAIDWHRPRWGTHWRTGDDVDLEQLAQPMRMEADNPNAWTVRMGSVKS